MGGKEILDLPKLPSGGGRDSCFALILPQNKYLLLLAETPEECRSGGHCAFYADCIASFPLNFSLNWEKPTEGSGGKKRAESEKMSMEK